MHFKAVESALYTHDRFYEHGKHPCHAIARCSEYQLMCTYMEEECVMVLCRLTELRLSQCEVTVPSQLDIFKLSNLEVSAQTG